MSLTDTEIVSITETVDGVLWGPVHRSCTDLVVINESTAAIYMHISGSTPSDQLTIGETLLYQFIPNPLHKILSDTIAVAGDIQKETLRLFESDGVVSHSITIGLDHGRSVTDTLTIREFVTFYMPTPDFVNPATPEPTRPGNPGTPGSPWDPGDPRVAGKITLTFNGDDLDLKFPDFGDTDNYDTFRVSRTSRGGDLQIYQDAMWPTTEVLSFKFSYLDPDDVDDLIDFMKTSLGRTITLKDHYGREWEGYIITPAGDVINDKRTTSTAAFKFQPTSGPT